jgi:hypothetical protein
MAKVLKKTGAKAGEAKKTKVTKVSRRLLAAANVVAITSPADEDHVDSTMDFDITGFRRPPGTRVQVQIVDLDDNELFSDSVGATGGSLWTVTVPADTLTTDTPVVLVIASMGTGLPQDVVTLNVD